ncbi:MAG: glycosyltransferase [Candidatus Micrarchaeota archaeon]|nr:glycosyltransferase [Candidatus Micrarchaeota archaeon]
MQYNNTTVVLPTFNEGKNIGKLISLLLKGYPGISVIVVDDGSSDSTLTVVKKIRRLYRNVDFIDRAELKLERGLTNSVIDGINKADTKYVVVMDADLQHPANKIVEIHNALENGNKLAIGVREKVPGWALHRKIISKSLIYLAYAVLLARGGTTSTDIFSGYFGADRKFFLQVLSKHKSSFVGEGYKVLFDLLKCIKRGSVRTCDVPYTFNVRIAGVSKASAKQVIALFASFVS